MLRHAVTLSAAALLVQGCGSANAFQYDPGDDFQCAVIFAFFHGRAEHDKAPDDQRLSARIMKEWYSVQVREEAAKIGFERAMERMLPAIEAVKLDPEASMDAVGHCTDRAAAHPGFVRFADTVKSEFGRSS